MFRFLCFTAELNGYSETVSKRSIPIQPQVVSVPGEGEDDRYSQFSHHSQKARSNRGFNLWARQLLPLGQKQKNLH